VQEHAAVVTFDDLGPYKYLLRVSQEGLVRDRHADALRRLLEYDRARQAQLVRTLEEYLRQRGRVASTAAALYVHPNTLRQRLRRIEEITGLDVREGEWLMIEIALKLLRLEELVG
jgi:DNA-binding PucR family transcriptional regulator